MTFDDYIKIFRAESALLNEERRQELEAAIASQDARKIFWLLERFRTLGEMKTPLFEKTLTDCYWQFCA